MKEKHFKVIASSAVVPVAGGIKGVRYIFGCMLKKTPGRRVEA